MSAPVTRGTSVQRIWSGELLPEFLFQQVDPAALAWFRILLALLLAYASWPRPSPLTRGVSEWPFLVQLYQSVFLSTPYRVVIYGAILWFALGWRPRIAGAVLFCLLFPHELLEQGRISCQLLLSAVLCTSLLRTSPIWRWDELKRSRPGPMWPIRLVQFQLTFLYGINALRKSTAAYLSGDVLAALSTSRPNFLVDLTSGHMSVGPLSVPVAALAKGTVAIEYWLAVGWWIPRCRWPTAVLGVAFHLFLKMFVIRIFMLDYAAMFLYLSFLLPFASSGEDAGDTVTLPTH